VDGVALERKAAIEKELIKCEKSVHLASQEAIDTDILLFKDKLRSNQIL